MKIKIENTDDDDGCVLITTTDRLAAIADQSIAGARWEAPGDMNEAYAMPVDRPGLVAELEADGYEVDDSEYSPPDEPEPGRRADVGNKIWPLVSNWPQRDLESPPPRNFHPEYQQQPVPIEEDNDVDRERPRPRRR